MKHIFLQKIGHVCRGWSLAVHSFNLEKWFGILHSCKVCELPGDSRSVVHGDIQNFEFVSGIQWRIDVDVLTLTSATVCHISKQLFNSYSLLKLTLLRGYRIYASSLVAFTARIKWSARKSCWVLLRLRWKIWMSPNAAGINQGLWDEMSWLDVVVSCWLLFVGGWLFVACSCSCSSSASCLPGIAPRKRDQLFGGCGIHATTSDRCGHHRSVCFSWEKSWGGRKKRWEKKVYV